MIEKISKLSNLFLERAKNKRVRIISHHDTDGITSAAIMAKTLSRLDIPFSVKIIKQLEKEIIDELNQEDVNLFLDLGSASFSYLKNLENVFILDHHEVIEEVPENINIINPYLEKEENINGSSVAYLFSKSISENNKDLAYLGVIGMVGDTMEQNLSKFSNSILNDAEVLIKRGLLFYPATRPVHKVLEFSSVFIPGVTGSSKGAIELLREAGIERINGEYKSLIELDEEEQSKLITSIVLRTKTHDNLIGNIYLIKLYNKLEDVRELSAMINACSRLGEPEVAFSLCLGNEKARKKAQSIYTTYKQYIINALNCVSSIKKIEGRDYIILNAKDQIKDTIIGTIASILSSSHLYDTGTIIVAMAYSQDKVKVSARITGRKGKNLRELIDSVAKEVGGEAGGHPAAAGCIISKENEDKFIETLKKKLEIELVKI